MPHAPSEALALGELPPLEVYLVGGAVRDGLLGLAVRERDWVVVGAREEEMLGRGFRRADADFPVFLHPLSGEEYALARSERKTGEGYRGFTLDYAPEITLEQDLARRDLTINAMAQDAEGRIIDPFKGREDLERGRLRHLTPAFSEDPVRLLRIARFAARLGGLGFRLAHSTQHLLHEMVSSGELLNLTRERIWRETAGALADDQPWRYFEVLESCGALAVLMPEIHAAMGRSGQHGGASPALDVLMRLTRRSPDPALRFGAWLASILPAQRLAGWCDEQRTGKAVRELTLRLGECLALAEPLAAGDPDAWAWLLKGWNAKVHPALPEGYMVALAALQPRLAAQIEPWLPLVREAWDGVSGAALRAEGFAGGELGRELARRRRAAITQVFGERGQPSE